MFHNDRNVFASLYRKMLPYLTHKEHNAHNFPKTLLNCVDPDQLPPMKQVSMMHIVSHRQDMSN